MVQGFMVQWEKASKFSMGTVEEGFIGCACGLRVNRLIGVVRYRVNVIMNKKINHFYSLGLICHVIHCPD
jgi:hypothetical protein